MGHCIYMTYSKAPVMQGGMDVLIDGLYTCTYLTISSIVIFFHV